RFFGYDSFRDLDLTFEIQSRSSGEFYIPACWQDQDKARCLKLYDANGNFIKKIDLNTKLKSQAKISNDLDFREVRSQDHALYIFDGGGIRVEESDMP
ncbi:MAG TPA: hypothetical protein VN132_09265, partial [Bdellovibrio sp.]|nr:hypothetical protein [Bdellovibrio sp.]